jgi:glycosyltransferase involved in cell wall biosynthesis
MNKGRTDSRKKIEVWNSPRQGGPLRWSKDLTAQINKQGTYQAKLVTHPMSLISEMAYTSADVIHAAVPVVGRLWRKPLVLTVKGDYTIEKNIWKWLYPVSIQFADVITVPSRYLIDRIPALAKAVVIPNAVDLKQFSVSSPPEGEVVRILMVTNFWFPEKARGVEHLLSLIQQTLATSPNTKIQVTIVGDGVYLEKIKRSAANLPFEISFPGWSDPRKFFSTTNLFLYYSFHDNMPNALLEAMASGLPVMTNEVGAVSEMIVHERDGLVPSSDEQYIQYLRQLLTDSKARQKLAQAARARIEKDFSWDRVIGRYLEIYRKFLPT